MVLAWADAGFLIRWAMALAVTAAVSLMLAEAGPEGLHVAVVRVLVG